MYSSNIEIFANSNRFGTRKRRSMKVVIRKLIPLLNDIQIKNNNGSPKRRPERIWADNTKCHTFLVLTYLYNRRIRAQIRERRVIPNQKKVDQIFSCTKTIRKSEVV
jgi:hypothetical protein